MANYVDNLTETKIMFDFELTYKNQDCLEFLSTIEEGSIDLVLTDPPYYRVVNDSWDNQWFTSNEYYSWCKQWIEELSRICKYSASFWLFGYPQQLAHLLPVIIKNGWTFRQQIVIDKGIRSVAGRTSKNLKMYPTATESIYYFHYESRDIIRSYLQSERQRLGLNGKQCNQILGKATTGGGTFACIASEKKPLEHRTYPTRIDWTKLQSVMNLPDYDDLVYKFNLQSGLTDVWTDINFYHKDKKIHSTQKPLSLMQRIIETSSNKGDKVLDMFAGSGSTAVACKGLNRHFTGCEVDKKYYNDSLERINNSCVGCLTGTPDSENPLLSAII